MEFVTMEVTLQLFGAFRTFGNQLKLSLKKNSTVSDIRKALLDQAPSSDMSFDKKALIEQSRFATETEVLSEATPLEPSMVITIIPPVSGG
jgi:molybdopterin converting factor small subunit